jgi:hypothetical protein
VTITHPCHPLHGQRLQVINLHRGAEPEIVVQFPGDHHVRVPLNWTDYPSSQACHPPSDPSHLLDLDGLRQVVQLVDRIRRDDRDCPTPSGNDDEDGKEAYNEAT